MEEEDEETKVGRTVSAEVDALAAVVGGALGVSVVNCVYHGARGAHFVVKDGSGNYRRVIVAPAGEWSAVVGDEQIRAQHQMRCVIETQSHYTVSGFDLWVTAIPAGTDLCALLRSDVFDDDSKMTVAIGLCDAVAELAANNCIHGALSPAAVFVDPKGRVFVDGVGNFDAMSGYWAQRLSVDERELKDYRKPGAEKADDVFSVATMLFEVFSGSLPRGSFYRMPSERSVFEPKLDLILLDALGHREKRDQPMGIVELGEELRVVGYGGPAHYEVHARNQSSAGLGRKGGKVGTTDGMLSWIPGWAGWVAILVAILGVGAVGYVAHERKQMQHQASAMVDPALRMLDEAEQLFAIRKRAEALQKVAMVAERAPISKEIIERMAALLIGENEYDALVKEGGRYKHRALAEEGPAAEDVVEIFRQEEERVKDFREAMSWVDGLALFKDFKSQNVALGVAGEIMPLDRHVAKLLEGDPLQMHRVGVERLASLQIENPHLVDMRWSLRTNAHGQELDLAGNVELRAIVELQGMPLRKLDLSGARVRDLRPLESAPLEVFNAHRTQIRSLAPIGGAPLQSLGFVDTQVRSASFLENRGAALSYCGHVDGRRVSQLAGPQSQKEWQNERGMRFVPLGDSDRWIAVHEVCVANFRAFVEQSNHRCSDQSLPPKPKEWPRDEEALRRECWAVTHVSRADAEAFCRWLTQRDLHKGHLSKGQSYRLPTDLEWSMGAGLVSLPFQDPRSRVHSSVPLEREQVNTGIFESSGGLREPLGLYPTLGMSDDQRAKIAKRAQVGSLNSQARLRDLTTGVREWLADSWSAEGESGVVRGASWMMWQGHGNGIEDPRLLRTKLASSARVADVGFRVLIDGAGGNALPAVDSWLVDGDWQKSIEVAREWKAGAYDPALKAAALSILSVAEGGSSAESWGNDRYLLFSIPMTHENASKLCHDLGGELAVPEGPMEERWFRRQYLQPAKAAPLWAGRLDAGQARIALPWPANQVDVAADEQHPFVIRWRATGSQGITTLPELP